MNNSKKSACVTEIAITFLKNKATEDELCRHFTTSTGQPHKIVKDELRRILRNGCSHGFLTRKSNKYMLSSTCNEYLVDADEVAKETECDEEEEEEDGKEEEKDWCDADFKSACEKVIQKTDCAVFPELIIRYVIDEIEKELKNKTRRKHDIVKSLHLNDLDPTMR